MSATVEIRMSGGSPAKSMRETRMWLDHHNVVPLAFRQSTCAQGLALHIEFDGQRDAEEFVARFGGRVLGVRAELVEQSTAAARGFCTDRIRLIFSSCATGRVPSMCR